MDFGSLPPEINSARLYAGPGAGPMLAAAAAWEGLASDLQSAAVSYQSAISELVGAAWLGPSSVQMVAAATPYVTWLSATAAQTGQTAAQARTAAAAYEAAFAMTVPPPAIAANRSLLMSLVVTNFLGQNLPAIAATEAHYMEMWAQDAAAMYGYAGQSASASALTPFMPAPNITNPAGLAGQAAAIGQSTATQTIVSMESQLLSNVATALQGFAQPAQSISGLSGILDALGFNSVQSFLALGNLAVPYTVAATTVNMGMGATHLAQWQAAGAAGSTLGSEVGSGVGALASAGPGNLGGLPVTAAVGQAGTAGGLSLPRGWSTTGPGIRTVAAALPVTGASVDPAALPDAALFSDAAPVGMSGCVIGGTAGRRGGRERADAVTRQGVRPPQGALDGQITGIVADLQKLAELRNSAVLTDREFTELKGRLIGR